MQFKPWQQQLWISFKRMGGCALCRDSSTSTMEHPGTQGWPHPLKAQGLKYHIAKICFPHTAAASSIFRGKKPSCVCPEPSSQQDSLFSWHLPDTSPSLKVGPVLSVFPKFPLLLFQPVTGTNWATWVEGRLQLYITLLFCTTF